MRITDVSPRDGLQNEPGTIPTPDKVRLVELLSTTGVDEVEVSSFVSPRWIPQLGDASEVFAALGSSKPQHVIYSALVPNDKGMDAALDVNARAGKRVLDKIAVFTAASESFAKRNINATVAESIRRFEPVVGRARDHGLPVRGYISCVVRCPIEGAIAPERVAQVAQAIHDVGVDELDLGDTIGAAEPADITILLHGLVGRLGDAVLGRITLHLHDTFGRAAECVREALQLGVRSFDGSVAGLGGCPFAGTPERRAPGNISTESLVKAVVQAGFRTGVSLDRLTEAARFAGTLPARVKS